jgi:hypothetical protein
MKTQPVRDMEAQRPTHPLLRLNSDKTELRTALRLYNSLRSIES